MNFTFPDLEIDVFQCFDARKGFGDALHFQYDSGHGTCSSPLLFQSDFFFGVIIGADNVLLHIGPVHGDRIQQIGRNYFNTVVI
ncbi:hypothetical protein D3C76_1661750 [compost metagenome]